MITNAGSVGIGTSTPTTGLYVAQGGDFSGVLSPGFPANLTVNTWIKGQGDKDMYTVFQSGTTVDTRDYLAFMDHTGGTYNWLTGRNALGNWILYDAASDAHRFIARPSSIDGVTYINSVGAAAVIINGITSQIETGTNVGTGGLSVRSGGVAPTTYFATNGIATSVNSATTVNANLTVSSGLVAFNGNGSNSPSLTVSVNGASLPAGNYGVKIGVPTSVIPLGLRTAIINSSQPAIMDMFTGTGQVADFGMANLYPPGSSTSVSALQLMSFTPQLSLGVSNSFSPSAFLLTSTVLVLGGGSVATPTNFALQAGGSSRPLVDSNVAGGSGTIQSGLGTGTGTPSTLIFQTPIVAASGNAAQTYATALTLGANQVAIFNGNVGIGTTGPALKLDVQDSQSATAAAMVTNTNSGANASGLIVKLGFTGTGASTNHFVNFLDGNGRIQGSIQSNGANGVTYAQNGIADFAEYLKAASPSALPAGTVVCQSDSGIVACDKDTTSKVVGIRSDHPAFLGGVNSPSSVIVGFVGQVPVRIAPDSSPIAAGDFLTVSSTHPGMTQKSVQAGYTVAKALEGWSSSSVQTTILGSINLGYTTGDTQIALAPPPAASGSSALATLNILPPQSMDLASVSAQFGRFSDTLKVIGKTQLGDTSIGGKLSVGLITVDDLKADISAMNGLLSFQQGAVQIDGAGNITTTGTIAAKKLNISEETTASGSAVLSSSIGQAVIPAGQTRVEVKTAAVTNKSRIFVTPRSDTGDHVLVVKDARPGESFTVTIKDTIASDISLDWWIVN